MRLDLYSKNQLKKLAARFFLRLQHTNPFPIMVDDVIPDEPDIVYQTYLSCLPVHIRDAVLLLMSDDRYVNFFDYNSRSPLSINVKNHDDSNDFIAIAITFNFSRPHPSCPPYDYKAKLDPEHPMYNEVIKWAHKAKEIKQECRRCNNFIGYIVEQANTVGQLRTLFPDYVHLLPAHQQEHISKMQKRARLPKDINEEYLNKHRRFVAEKIALCMLLPEGGQKIWLS